VAHKPLDGGIQLIERPVGFKVYTATIRGVSGFTGICVICDEVAKWRDADTGANPAKEVLASVRPTMATMPLARIVLSSSPMGKLDAHAAAFEEGEDDFQIVDFAPTWVANPTITEDDTRKLERDEAKRQREYGAIPMEGNEEGLITSALLDMATRAGGADIAAEPGVTYVAAMDPAFTRNGWTFVIAGQRWVSGRVRRSVVCAREWRGNSVPNNPETVLGEIASLCKPYRVTQVLSDQYEQFGLSSIAQRVGIFVHVPERTAAQRLGDYESLEILLADGVVELPTHSTLRADLLSIRRKLTPNGFTIHLPLTPDGRHADYAPSVVLALTHCLTPPPAPVVEMTPALRMAAIARAQDRMWSEAMKRGDEAAMRRAPEKDWIEQLEEAAYGTG
jgi:hypothetical protein